MPKPKKDRKAKGKVYLDKCCHADLGPYKRRVESVELLKQCFSRSELPEHERYKLCILNPRSGMSELPENEIYERFMESLKKFKVPNEVPKGPSVSDGVWSKCLGPLSAEKLPWDAWNEWCNDGVHAVCFGLIGPGILKIYFGNSRDGLVYHVVDFIYSDFLLEVINRSLHVTYTLFGSEIYVFCHHPEWCPMPVHVYRCNVARPSRGKCYKWNKGPVLKLPKYRPRFFTLAGSLYVFSCRPHLEGFECSFEVLKPNSSRWKMLDPPPFTKKFNDDPAIGDIIGTLVCQDANKFLIRFGTSNDYILSIYDAEQNEWKEVECPFGLSSCRDSFVDVISESFARHAIIHNPGPLKSASNDPLQASFRLSLLEWLFGCGSLSYHYFRCLDVTESKNKEPSIEYPRKVLGQGAMIWEYKSIDFPHGLCLVPYSADKKTGSFSIRLMKRNRN